MLEFNELLNKPANQEFFILIMGPLFQIIFSYFFPKPYHIYLLAFNLLPIYPLDGSKLVFLIWNKLGTYYNSYKIVFYVSLIAIFVFLYYMRSLLFLVFGMFLLWKSFSMFRDLSLMFQIFLFERYKYTFNFKKATNIKTVKRMKRDYKHMVMSNSAYVSEKEVLEKMFSKRPF